MKIAVLGHPKQGCLWNGILKRLGWSKNECWCGIFLHTHGSIFILYVDEFMLVATVERANAHCKELATSVEFSEEAAPILRYLGAMYRLDVS